MLKKYNCKHPRNKKRFWERQARLPLNTLRKTGCRLTKFFILYNYLHRDK